MDGSVHVNLHTHTIFSDGEQTPEALAESLAEAGVRYAALTDHDTLEGLARFAHALERRGIPSLPGVELTTQLDGRELHLVGYGFDPDHPELAATLVSLRQARNLEVHSIAGSLRKAGSRRPAGGDAAAAISAAPNGTLEMGDAIALLQRAGGRAFWAHPLVHETDPVRLDALVARLAAMGLDGLEVVYAQFSPDEQATLRQLARTHDLLVSAGTDFHGPTGIGNQPPGIDMPRDDWQRFRAAVVSGPGHAAGSTGASDPGRSVAAGPSGAGAPPHRFARRSFVLRIALPTLAAMALFLVALWGLMLPSFEQTLLERKREMIRELTNSAHSILAAYQRDEQRGLLTRDQAQSAAARLVQELRYGPDGKDYFWIQDTQPRMVMHPYRTDLDGQDLSGFTDPRGVAIFVEFADLVRREGQGYVDYVWQWQDDPDRLEPKESYVKGFAPWGWIVGTGLYTDDVRQEIGRIEQDLIAAALAISAAIAVLLLFVLQQSLRIERGRQEVVQGLRDSTARYHSLVEATTEGTLLVLDGRCRYANPTLLGMLGYTPRQLEFLELSDVLPRAANETLWQTLDPGAPEALLPGEAREGSLSRRDGSQVACILTLNPIELGGQRGSILLAREVGPSSAAALDQVDPRDATIETLQAALPVLHEIAGASTPEDVARGCERAVPLAGNLVDSSARPRVVTSLLTTICDAATTRLIALAIEELGQPPVPFAFIAMGSQGRQEMTLLTDQDNGIVYAAPGETDREQVAAYFLRLGSRVCEGLQRAGYAFCRGKVMADQPTWCDSLPGWLSRYDTWVRRAEPQDIADLSVFVDVRVVHGDAALVEPLRRRIHATLPEAPAVLYRFARNALIFRPPLRLPGDLYVAGGAEHTGEIDLKDALMPIVAFARVEAQRHGIAATNTLERIDALSQSGALPPSSRDEITAVYDFLLQLRLQTQLDATRAGRPPTSRVRLASLDHPQRELLRQAFGQIAAMQSRIGYEFPEGG